MLRIFKKKQLLSTEDLEFQITTYNWLLRNFGGEQFYKYTTLVLPNNEFFPSEVKNEKDAVNEIFEKVKSFAGLGDWPCSLIRQSENVNPLVSPTIVIKNVPIEPLGTYCDNDIDNITITYNPSLLESPMQLVGTFAHELSHLLTSTSGEAPPGGWENWEFVTDITATFLGFGIFMSNSAFNFRQFSDTGSQGWKSTRSGYLSEIEHVYSLAIFLTLKKIPFEEAKPYLKAYLRKILKKAIKEISEKNIILMLDGKA